MVIRRLKIKNFGKIRNRDMELIPGINVLYGENESGKTTTHTFIRSMFYGVRRLRGKAAQNDTYTKYEPWKILPNMVGSCGLQVKERIIALQEIFIKKRKWENFSVKMTEALWMRNRELLSLFSEM